ncbi:flagellar biosynthesis protein FlhA [Glacieibacterium frigidum]|uniref:FHIPEP family type III secretion protein n=1 Tax=Glacieibacterium frigidum TaxID=2593303 RepID=A0A552UGQ8_9SPHN|nr:flagellar biosynthesis protein FlhA [Glacieibacterium frigidum]TRW17367.1 FHIPEP family type III secretion protein [Glacieibacterium frigidum]
MSARRFLDLAPGATRSSNASRFADVILVAGVVSIIGMMILPLPVWLVDTLVAFNITFGVLLLLTTLYVKTPLDFSSFPSILLVTTLFRLALSVATTRMILIDAHAGKIIEAFGTMVAGGNLVVGLVVYIIIVVVQFIVIAKGAERVAEVAARFSLDSMPGKQLSIDSDLRSGLIDKDEARRRRRTLELESKLHGSLDGAMKFVKGDAIASIIIVIINLIGGMAIGVFQRDMAFGDAARTYSILTIGEGLVAQIPALLSAMAAGLLVTRSTDEEKSQHLGEAIRFQLAANPRVLLFVGGIALLMALVPGFPSAVFVGLGAALLIAGAATHPRLKPRFDQYTAPLRAQIQRGPEPAPVSLLAAPAEPRPLVPLLLQVTMPPSAAEANALRTALTEMLDTLQYRVGLPLPSISVHFEPGEARHWELLAFESTIGGGEMPESDVAALVAAVRSALRHNLAMFMGVQETTAILNKVGADYPEVVKEAVRTVPTTRIAEVLRRLMEEEVPLRNMRDVLEGLAEAGAQEREPARIADLTRVALKRYLIGAYAEPDGSLKALVVASELEAMIRGQVQTVDGVERVAFEPDQARELVAAVAAMAAETGAKVVLTGFDIRRALRKLIEPDIFDLPVLAFNELSSATRLEVVGQVRLGGRTLPSAASIAAE